MTINYLTGFASDPSTERVLALVLFADGEASFLFALR